MKNLSNLKIYSFFQPLFCQCSSAHLQKANARPTAYFTKELTLPILSWICNNTFQNIKIFLTLALQSKKTTNEKN